MVQLRFIYFIAFLITLLLTVVSYFYIDKPLALYFYTLENSEIKAFFHFMTQFGKSEWYLIPTLLLFLYFRKRERRQASTIALYLFMTNVIAGIGVWFFKIPFGRMRPEFYLEENLYGFEWFEIDSDFASFPSGHTITAISSAVALMLLFPRWKYLFLILGSTIAFSRVVGTRHFLSDIIFASFLGSMVAILLHQYYFKAKEH
jgi:membrane-associated phospholipid phosphatase